MEVQEARHGGIIVVGAHRSGTSMTAGLLRSLGVEMGADCGVLEESAFFRNLNIRMLGAAGASWHRPGLMWPVLQDARRQGNLAERLRRAVEEPARAGYLGLPGPAGAPRIEDLPRPWGWKDPRSTVTLPLWRLVFPRARVVHIVRNGVDVAQSLVERERKGAAPTLKPLKYLAHRAWPQRWPEFKWRPFRDLHDAFDLWAEYARFGLEATSHLTQRECLLIRYEDFLAAPRAGLNRLAEFLEVTVDADVLQRLSATVVRERRFTFAASSSLTDFYRRCQDHPMMRRFGYDHLCE